MSGNNSSKNLLITFLGTIAVIFVVYALFFHEEEVLDIELPGGNSLEVTTDE